MNICNRVNLEGSQKILSQFRAKCKSMSPNSVMLKRSFTTSYSSSPLSLFPSDPSSIRIKMGEEKKVVILSATSPDSDTLELRKTEITTHPNDPNVLSIKIEGQKEEFELAQTNPVVLGSGQDVFEHIPSAFVITNELDSVVIETLDSRGIFVAMDPIKEPKILAIHVNWAVTKSYCWLRDNIVKDRIIETAQRNNNINGNDKYLGFPEFITLASTVGEGTIQAAIFPLKINLEGRILTDSEALTDDHFVTYFGYETQFKNKRAGFSDELKHYPLLRVIGPGLQYNAALPKVIADILNKSLLYYNGTR